MFEAGLYEGRVVTITGGGSGLGRAMAERLAGLGAKVGIVGRTQKKLEDTVAAIASAGGTAAWATADVRDPAALEAAFASLDAQLGPSDTLVNNAAGNFLAPSEEALSRGFVEDTLEKALGGWPTLSTFVVGCHRDELKLRAMVNATSASSST